MVTSLPPTENEPKGDAMKLNPIGSNMTEVETEKGLVLFSYKTPVAAVVNGQPYKTSKRWSNTTTRHINKWFSPGFVGSQIVVEKPQAFFDSLV